jgi:hypothetical protein
MERDRQQQKRTTRAVPRLPLREERVPLPDEPLSQAPSGGYQDSESAFPFLIYNLLEDATKLGFESIVSWKQGGTSFMVTDREKFTERIMPAYFDQTRYKSFQRQLNFYQFERTKSGPYKGMNSPSIAISSNQAIPYRSICQMYSLC